MLNIVTIYKIDEVTALAKGKEEPSDNSKRRDISGSSRNNDDDGDDEDYGSDNNSNDILQDADELAKRSDWSIDFALLRHTLQSKSCRRRLEGQRLYEVVRAKIHERLGSIFSAVVPQLQN